MSYFIFAFGLRNQLWRFLVVISGLLLMNSACLGQCNCPPVNSCAPCNGEVNSLKLRYLGNFPFLLVTVSDNVEIVHWSIVGPGDEISFTGSLTDGLFAGNRARIFLNGFAHTTIDTRCSAGIFVGDTYGDFVVVEATSRNNGPMCCNGTGAESEEPTFTGCPDIVEVTAEPGTCSQVVSWTPPQATDNCDLVSLTSTHTPGMSFPVGTTLVTYFASDQDGNNTQCVFTVAVTENAAPIINGCPSTISVSANAFCEAEVTWEAPVVSDNCSGVTLTSTHERGSTFQVGTTSVTYTATDASGNVTSCSFDVVVRDLEPELVFSNCPDSLTVEAEQPGPTSVMWQEPLFHGACSGLTLAASHLPGSFFEDGETKVTYTASGNDGVVSMCSFIISVTRHELVVHEIVTPNGDGVNDVWIIENIENYSDNSVILYDRWGSVVYRADGYDNKMVSWNGGGLPDGTYFYRLATRKGNKIVNKTGFIELVK